MKILSAAAQILRRAWRWYVLSIKTELTEEEQAEMQTFNF